MFKYWAIKKYGTKLLPTLEERYGNHKYYTASQVRATVYQCDFNEKYLPLGYLLHLPDSSLQSVLAQEFPQLNINDYKKEILSFIDGRPLVGVLKLLS